MNPALPPSEREWQKDFDEKFADPMTEKHGEGFALYCSFCDGSWREQIKAFIREVEDKSFQRGKDAACDYVKENAVWAKVNPVDDCFLITKPLLEEARRVEGGN